MESPDTVSAASPASTLRSIVTIPVIVASLGYFVDIYDLIQIVAPFGTCGVVDQVNKKLLQFSAERPS
jgi:hypothetical protein